ncbi:MAG: histidinol-phosphatase [Rhodospirillales bacterium]|nr:histidinol-phosphatase [Rhodospirillales bacterium]
MTLPREPPPEGYLDFAHGLADLAGAVIRPYFRRTLTVRNKAGDAGFDPVTAADRAAERVIRAAIAKRYPDHGILGEEFAAVQGAGRYQWLVDPIDGTRAFIMGSPLWGTLIGLVENGKPLLGLMDQPFTGERFWASKGIARMRAPDGRTRRLRTRGCSGLAEAVLTSTHPDLFASQKELSAFARLKVRARLTRYGGDCYGYCLLAAGFIDVIVEAGLKAYDVAALIPIIEGAGGRITTWDDKPALQGGRILATGDARVHKEALALLNG